MNTEEYRSLIRQNANAAGRDADEAVTEFVDVVRQMNATRRDCDALHDELLDLGRQYGFYRNGDPYDGDRLLDEKELGRRYASLKARHRAIRKTLAIRTTQANALLGEGVFFRHGRPVDTPDATTAAAISSPLRGKSELVVLDDPDGDDPIVLEMFGS